MKIGLIGAGAIARYLLNEMNDKQYNTFRIESVFVRDKEKYRMLEIEYGVQLFLAVGCWLLAAVRNIGCWRN